MTRDQQLQFCKVCQHKSFDVQHGIICSLTGRQADFQGTCPTFQSVDGSDPILDALEGKSVFDAELAMASGTKRFINMIVDTAVFYLFVIFFGGAAAIMTALLFPDQLEQLSILGSPLWSNVISISLYFAYYTILEASTGRTIGKLITGTIVVDRNGKPPSTGAIIRRSLTRLVPFEAFSFLGSPRGWHDRWTDTWVVEKK